MLRLLFFLSTLLLPWAVSAQVSNNNIETRLELTLNSVFRSSTENCTVQRSCVDESLTGKCVQYHNDQWFYFNTKNHDVLYLNLWNQQCRSLQGVQLIVIDGEPCQPETYKILSCTSLETQDDIYVKLSNLRPNSTYLLNIDGYLNDQCNFNLALSDVPRGFPVSQPLNNLETNRKAGNQTISISWKLSISDLSDSLSNFMVTRHKITEAKAILVGVVPLAGNAYGLSDSYQVTDSAQPGMYVYRIYAVKHNAEKVLLSEFREEIFRKEKTTQHTLTLNFPDSRSTPYDIFILDAETNLLIWKDHFIAHRKVTSYALKLPENGTKVFRVVIKNLKNGWKREELVNR